VIKNLNSFREDPCDFSPLSLEKTVNKVAEKPKLVPSDLNKDLDKFRIANKIEKCIKKLNDKFNFFKEYEKLEDLIKNAKIAFLKGRLRTRIRGDVNNKLGQWSIKYAVDKFGLQVDKSIGNQFKYWDHRGYWKFYHFLKTEENAYIHQENIVKDLLLYTLYQDIISILELKENFQTYHEVETIYFELVKKGKHIGKDPFKVYRYCIMAVISDDLIEDNERAITESEFCDALNINSYMYRNLVRAIFQIRSEITPEKDIIRLVPESAPTKSLIDKYLALDEAKSQSNMESRAIDESDFFKPKKIRSDLIEFIKTLHQIKDKFQEKTLNLIIFLFYRYLEERLLIRKKNILQIAYSACLTFDKGMCDSLLTLYLNDPHDIKTNELNICESKEFIEYLDEFLHLYQLTKRQRHRRIKLKDSILDYKIGAKGSKISGMEKDLLSIDQEKMQTLVREDIKDFFEKIEFLIEHNHPLNPRIIVNLYSIINLCRNPSIKTHLPSNIFYTLLLFIINQFYKSKRTRQIKISLIETLLKALIINNEPIFLYFMKHLIKTKKVDMKFVVFAENHLISPGFNLFSLAFFEKSNYSKIYTQRTLNNYY